MNDIPWWLNEILGIFDEIKGWLMALIGVVAGVQIARYILQYLSGDDDEKVANVKRIRKTIIVGAGAIVIVWFASYLFDRMMQAAP